MMMMMIMIIWYVKSFHVSSIMVCNEFSYKPYDNYYIIFTDKGWGREVIWLSHVRIATM